MSYMTVVTGNGNVWLWCREAEMSYLTVVTGSGNVLYDRWNEAEISYLTVVTATCRKGKVGDDGFRHVWLHGCCKPRFQSEDFVGWHFYMLLWDLMVAMREYWLWIPVLYFAKSVCTIFVHPSQCPAGMGTAMLTEWSKWNWPCIEYTYIPTQTGGLLIASRL